MEAKKDLLTLQKEFINLRFGMFIHFNSATVQFHSGEIVDWEFGCENAGEPRRFPFDPADWNPQRINCSQWAKAAKGAGMEFAALTAKHHEGFALWPSACTEHCVKNSPVKTDVVAEYLASFRREGIRAGLYFSILDLTHPVQKTHCTPSGQAFVKEQLTELLTGYGEIPFLIMDGWNAPWGGPTYADLPFEEIDNLVKGLQPNCLLMNIGATDGLTHTDIPFFENAAGQQVTEDFSGPGVCCNYLTKQWFWRDTDPHEGLRPASWVLDTIREMNRKNTAFILNGSPNPDGLLDDNLVGRFREIGDAYNKCPPLRNLPQNWLRR